MLTWLKREDKVVMVDDVSLTLNFGNERSSFVEADLENSNHGRPTPDFFYSWRCEDFLLEVIS